MANPVDPQLQTMIDNMPEKTGKSLDEWVKLIGANKLEKQGKKIIEIKIRYSNHPNKQFEIKIQELEKEENGMVSYNMMKSYSKIVWEEDAQRFNFKRLCRICEVLGNQENEKKWIEDYKDWLKKTNREEKKKSLIDSKVFKVYDY